MVQVVAVAEQVIITELAQSVQAALAGYMAEEAAAALDKMVLKVSLFSRTLQVVLQYQPKV